jgi:hypothetical protein
MQYIRYLNSLTNFTGNLQYRITNLVALYLLKKSTQRSRLTDSETDALLHISIVKRGAHGAKSVFCPDINILKIIIKNKGNIYLHHFV